MRALPSAPVRVKRRGRGGQTACTECRNRKQKCEVRQGGPCNHCSRRYPPVECVFKSGRAPSKPTGAMFPEIVNTSVVATTVKGTAPNSRLATSGNSPSNDNLPFSTDDLLPKLILSEQQNPGPAAIGDLVTNLRKRVTDGVDRKQGHQSVPSSEAGDSLCLIPRKRMDVQPHLPTLSNPMPFGTTSFGGAILTDPGGGGPPPERVAQLLHFFHSFVVPNRCSVDGSDVPTFFVTDILPMIIPNMAILMASTAQSAEPELQISNASEQFALKANIFSLINNLLKQDRTVVARTALPAVLHLILIEWYWGNTANMWAHLQGARQIIRAQGGFIGINYPRLQQGLILIDWEIACACECEPFLQDMHAANEYDTFSPSTYPTALRSPLLPYHTTFQHDKEDLKLSPLAAEILDCIRLLTLAITYPISPDISFEVQNNATSLQRLLETWLIDKSYSTTTVSSNITSILIFSAQIYHESITTLMPLSQVWTSALRQEFYAQVSSVRLHVWKQIPGIFLWILLVACPGTGDDVMGKWIKRKMSVCGMMVALEDYGIAIGCLRAFWKVQKWIEKKSYIREVRT